MTMDVTIGGLAQAAGVNVETIRYYQRLGLLEEPRKPVGGYRRYTQSQARRVQFIKRAQALGFTLSEIGGLLRLDGARACRDTRKLAARKLKLIDQRIADLSAMRRTLVPLIRCCVQADGHDQCPIIEDLWRVGNRE